VILTYLFIIYYENLYVHNQFNLQWCWTRPNSIGWDRGRTLEAKAGLASMRWYWGLNISVNFSIIAPQLTNLSGCVMRGLFLAGLQTWRALIFSRVCLSVYLWPALLPFSVNRFWGNLVTRTLLWSSLAATMMVQIGRKGTAQRLFENFKKFSKITAFEFQNSGPSFFASVSPAYCKKFDSIRTKLTEEIDF